MHDYHIHTSLCKHAHGRMEEYVEAAIDMGLTEMCFTDHIPMQGSFDSDHRMSLEELDIYLETTEELRRSYPEISILCGIEADYIEGYERYLEDFLKQYSFDIVIMSVHFIAGWPDGNWVFHFDFPHRTYKEIYHDYLDAMLKGIETGLFDIVGHLDLIKREGRPLLKTNREDVEKIFDAAFQQGMAIEINTSGLRKNIGEIFPAPDIIKGVVKRGIPMTMTSDAHLPKDVGYRFREIRKQVPAFKEFIPRGSAIGKK
ncbi:MAG: histidinol-phosphatase HisJ [bacterium]|nr:histidinol-phosphatase HisJ [bacterium]